MKNRCKFSEKIYMYLNDELNSSSTQELLEHMKICKECSEEFNMVKEMQKELGNFAEVELPKRFRENLHKRLEENAASRKVFKFENYTRVIGRLAAAAAAVLVVVVAAKGINMLNPVLNNTQSLSQVSDEALNQKAGLQENTAAAAMEKPEMDSDLDSVKERQAYMKSVQDDSAEEKSLTDRVNYGEILGMGETQPDKPSSNVEAESRMAAPDDSSQKSIPGGKNPPVQSEGFDVTSNPKYEHFMKYAAEAGEVSFETLFKDVNCGYSERNNLLVSDKKNWEEVWNKIKPDSSFMPEVDFSRSIVIAVCQGTKPTGGYGVEITKVIEKEDSLVVFVKETEPEPGSIVTEALTAPCHIIRVDKLGKSILFEKQE